MKKTLLLLIAALALLFVACDDSSDAAAGGTYTVTLTGDGTNVGDEVLFALVPDGTDIATANVTVYGYFNVPANGATASGTAQDETTGTNWIADSNTAYDLYLFIDANGSEDPDAGDLTSSDYWPKNITSINDNTTLSINESELTTDLSTL